MQSHGDSEALPEWRENLLAVPETERCPTQHELIRALELVDTLIDTYARGNPRRISDTIATNRNVLIGLETASYVFRSSTI